MMAREELEAALDEQQTIQSEQWESYHADVKAGYMDEDTLRDWSNALTKHDLIIAAARKQLALTPEKCGTCGGREPNRLRPGEIICPDCHGSGKVYPPETVGLFRKVVDAWAPDLNAYAKSQFVLELLDALGEA